MPTSKHNSDTAGRVDKTSAEKPVQPDASPAGKIKPAQVVVPAISVIASKSDAIPAAAAVDAGDKQMILKKQELVNRIVKASGAKKKDVKLILEAALGVLGDALSAGEELNLPPLGKLKVNRSRSEGTAEVLILKLRRGGGKAGGGNETVNDVLAAETEDD